MLTKPLTHDTTCFVIITVTHTSFTQLVKKTILTKISGKTDLDSCSTANRKIVVKYLLVIFCIVFVTACILVLLPVLPMLTGGEEDYIL